MYLRYSTDNIQLRLSKEKKQSVQSSKNWSLHVAKQKCNSPLTTYCCFAPKTLQLLSTKRQESSWISVTSSMSASATFAAVLFCTQIFLLEAQPPSFKPSTTPTYYPSYIATPAPSNPTMAPIAPSASPTRAIQIYISKGALAAAVIFSCVAFSFISMMFIYLCIAPKGSSPCLFFFPSYYIKFYPGRELYVEKVEQPVTEKAELISDDKDRVST